MCEQRGSSTFSASKSTKSLRAEREAHRHEHHPSAVSSFYCGNARYHGMGITTFGIVGVVLCGKPENHGVAKRSGGGRRLHVGGIVPRHCGLDRVFRL